MLKIPFERATLIGSAKSALAGVALLFWSIAVSAQPPAPSPSPGAPASPGTLGIGRELSPSGSGGDLGGILSTIGVGLGGGVAKIDRLVVAEESTRRVSIDLYCTACAGWRIKAEVRGTDRRSIPGLPGVSVAVPAEGTVSLVFELAAEVAEGTVYESGQLKLELLNPGLPIPIESRYALAKVWSVPVRPENQVVRVVAVPQGAAASLPATLGGAFVLPPRRVILSAADATVLAPGAFDGATVIRAIPSERRRIDPAATATVAGSGEAAAPAPAATPEMRATILRETTPVVGALKVDPKILQLSVFQFGIRQEDKSRGALGPGSQPIDLFEAARTDVDLSRSSLVASTPLVFLDQNMASGILYFLPRAYHLAWDADAGYGFKMLYGTSTTAGSAGEVLMAARLGSGVDTQEIQLARRLVEAYRSRHPEVVVGELRPLPIEAPPEISLGGDLTSLYRIPADRIAVHAISDVLGQIDVSWVTDASTLENLKAALREELGVQGNLAFRPAGNPSAQTIPVGIRIAEVGTFGTLEWRRDVEWRNRTPYPLRLKFLHALLLENNEPIVYSWSLGDTEIPPKAKVEVDASRVPAWLEATGAKKALRLWIDYAVLADCQPCDDAVIAGLTAGASAAAPSQITFKTATPLADTGAFELVLRVRSKFFHPRDRALIEKPEVVLDADGRDFTLGPIYVPERPADGSAPTEPLFEYRLTVNQSDGSSREGDRWIPSDRLRVLIGRVQVEQAIGAPTPPPTPR